MSRIRNLFSALVLSALVAGLVLAPITAARAATITVIQATVTETSAFVGTSILDVHALSGNFTVKLDVQSFTVASSTGAATICLEAAAVATMATASTLATYPAWCIQVYTALTSAGSVAGGYQPDSVFSVTAAQLPYTNAVVFGQTNGKFRFSLESITGATASIKYSGWLEQ